VGNCVGALNYQQFAAWKNYHGKFLRFFPSSKAKVQKWQRFLGKFSFDIWKCFGNVNIFGCQKLHNDCLYQHFLIFDFA